ncbi:MULTISPECIES: aminotransferase class IV [Hyphomonas]|uniref:Probable branched-chain-amino-acid aminotransferase n=1 Tax=Hyphomonas adhaerens TaxID=81029 RepID=A0A3B9GZ72_9PROT|nr:MULTISPECIES: aminotransferase class IV [Hyphomonas]MBB40937.1 class IV aminotransferase [Hyphomonas sp.]HAE27751.1 class IV aminotransferase [Hyphomonas adhaerens]|tara:strand:+ start:13781 stop:14623 length:843 start_codon:yes stop_codon:yes gene_type:complete
MPLIRLSQTVSSRGTVLPFDLTDRGLLLGDGAFDTSLVIDGHIVLRTQHFRRLLNACDVFGFAVKQAELEALADSTVPDGATGALRLTVTRGPGARGVASTGTSKPTLLASFTPQPVNFPAPAVRLGLSSILRNPTSPLSRYKTLSYGDTVMAQRQARQSGYDDALFVTPDGRVACSSIANVLVRFGSRLMTPPLKDGVIAGVMRGWILENAHRGGFEVSESSLSLEDLKHADNVFLTNSLRLMLAVRSIDDVVFDPGLPPALTALIDHLLPDLPGRDAD